MNVPFLLSVQTELQLFFYVKRSHNFILCFSEFCQLDRNLYDVLEIYADAGN